MKNIIPYKLFESESDLNYHLQAVKDIFQSLIDDYNMYDMDSGAHPVETDGDIVDPNYYYEIYNTNNHKKQGITIHMVTSKELKYESKFIAEAKSIIKRLESLGYSVEDYGGGSYHYTVSVDL